MPDKKKCIILDTDDVLLDYTPAIGKFAERHYNAVMTSVLPDETGYHKWLNCTVRDIDNIVEHFNERSWEFGTIPVIEKAARNVLELSHILRHDTDLVIVSKCGSKGHAVPLRHVNLYNAFGDIFSAVHILEYSESKKETFRKLQSSYDVRAVVDDNIKNLDDAIELDIPAYMFIREQNRVYSSQYTSFDNWDDLKDELIKSCR